jgi:hypothetical protein
MKSIGGWAAGLVVIQTGAGLFAQGHHTRNIMLTGYWPPTNDMLRPFSTNPDQNPGGWIGENWEGRGYNVYAFFPECGFPVCEGDFEVDYQDTSEDWWRITAAVNPVGIITFSRGARNRSWEIEFNQYNRSVWVDDYVPPYQPTPAPPDDSVPPETRRTSTLPVEKIRQAVRDANLGLSVFICYDHDGGGFLSEFIAYHGVWYQSIHAAPEDGARCIGAGHIHVGQTVPVEVGTQATMVSLRVLLDEIDATLGRVGDADLDGDIDRDDHAAFVACMTSPGGGVEEGCEVFDFNSDADTDLRDWASMQNAFHEGP